MCLMSILPSIHIVHKSKQYKYSNQVSDSKKTSIFIQSLNIKQPLISCGISPVSLCSHCFGIGVMLVVHVESLPYRWLSSENKPSKHFHLAQKPK